MVSTVKTIDCRQANEIWLGIPTIEITPQGRFIVAWFSGGVCEPDPKNRIHIQTSTDGISFSEPEILVEFPGMRRAYDPCLWMTPQGELWMTYNVSDPVENYNSFEAIVCRQPDADQLVWSEPRQFDFNLPFSFRMNKPLATSTGRWLIPLSWNRNPVHWLDCLKDENIERWSDGQTIRSLREESNIRWLPRKTPSDRDWMIKNSMLQGAAISDDQGQTWRFAGAVEAPDWAIENMIIERTSGELLMWIRTDDGYIWECTSDDGGETWGNAYRTSIENPGTRFYIAALADGRWLALNTPNKLGRDRICAYISTDEGRSWSPGLQISEGTDVSYPDAVEFEGKIYCVYDRSRYSEGAICMASFRPNEIPAS